MLTRLLSGLLIFFALSTPLAASAVVHVDGYYRKDGTYVAPHYRSDPDSSPYNNWSYPGNVNPYTGKVAPGNPDTYLNNYYSNSGGSTYAPVSTGKGLFGFDYDKALTELQASYVRSNANLACPANSQATEGQCECDRGYGVFNNKCLPAKHIELIEQMQAQVHALLIQIAALIAQKSATSTAQ